MTLGFDPIASGPIASVPVSTGGGGATPLTATDTAHGSEQSALQISASRIDSASGADSTTLSVTCATPDTGSGADQIGLTITIALADAGVGADAASLVRDQALDLTDSATGTDFASVAGEGAGIAPTGPRIDPKLVFATGDWNGPAPDWLRRAMQRGHDDAAASADDAAASAEDVKVLILADTSDAAAASASIHITKFDPDAEFVALVLAA